MRKALWLSLASLLLAGCNWGIKLDSAAKNIRTAWNDDVSACRDMGKVTVSVMDRVGPVDRNEIKVASELEVLARNSAAQMRGADTIKPLADPADGSQAWGVYECGSRTLKAAPARPAAPASAGRTQTFPVQGG
ncbi:MAG: DUF4156 domain-containing protein [Xanthomonadales bacterium]|nr:DUF4156 domain-containing protein [Xanthomonadales bacterium]